MASAERGSSKKIIIRQPMPVDYGSGYQGLGFGLRLERIWKCRDETKTIADICKSWLAKDAVQLVLRLKATKNYVKQNLAEAQLVHFAAHALINPRYEEGGIYFVKLAPMFYANKFALHAVGRTS
jgi:hypothetical protein